ncbi:Carboxylic ester hydrolase [Mycena indigotica]|uniref:Carboxylic ester hydrolase n=1 Tax=Mycena indigotica TaxID=2126181 RepID=A0A8H6RY81_9AGAR|nr:Carboxylic ester hydrolase [Mycena indigotica]KAF7289146.1 Carboxylic ester hydrolase [Mycena indigotica]
MACGALFVGALALLQIQAALAAVPVITLDNATFTGTVASSNTQSFFGIPFAQPPVGDLRFRKPAPIAPYTGSFNASLMGPSCPQQFTRVPVVSGSLQALISKLWGDYYSGKYPDSEDCLTINIIKPANANPNSKLPVALWLFAGGFEFGTPARYDGTPIVERSIAMNKPIIYVSINYRVSAFGFLGGKEVKEAGVGNLGLQDQREALRWMQKYISAFGGDPKKVTIWGESAGAISVALHMLTNGGNTEGLFRAGYMQSGSPIPVGPIDNASGQKFYDELVANVGCQWEFDTLACLRTIPYDQLKKQVDASPFFLDYQSLVLAWLPRVDGDFLVDNPQQLVLKGQVAKVPFIAGDCDDEGTVFSLSTLNITSDAAFNDYLATIWAPTAPNSTIAALANAYPSDITKGSPFDTGILHALTPQFKRLAAFQGDAVFHAPRRFFQTQLSGKQKQWGYLNKRNKAIPFVGSYHTSDVSNVFGAGELTDYLVNFVTDLDPNGPTVPAWPQYSTDSPNLMTFYDALLTKDKTGVSQDTFRVEAMKVLTEASLAFPI